VLGSTFYNINCKRNHKVGLKVAMYKYYLLMSYGKYNCTRDLLMVAK